LSIYNKKFVFRENYESFDANGYHFRPNGFHHPSVKNHIYNHSRSITMPSNNPPSQEYLIKNNIKGCLDRCDRLILVVTTPVAYQKLLPLSKESVDACRNISFLFKSFRPEMREHLDNLNLVFLSRKNLF